MVCRETLAEKVALLDKQASSSFAEEEKESEPEEVKIVEMNEVEPTPDKVAEIKRRKAFNFDEEEGSTTWFSKHLGDKVRETFQAVWDRNLDDDPKSKNFSRVSVCVFVYCLCCCLVVPT